MRLLPAATLLLACSGSTAVAHRSDSSTVAVPSTTPQSAPASGQAAPTATPLTNGNAAAPISEADAIALAATDAAADPQGADARYFSLSYLQSINVAAGDQTTVRKAVGKLLNSLAWATTLTVPQAVDQQGLLLKIHLRDYGLTAATWETLTAQYPKVTTTLAGLPALVALTTASAPVIRAEWFVTNASLAPLYYTLLGVAADFTALQAKVAVDIGVDVQNQKVLRSGFNNSIVSANDRVAERHALNSGGFLWRTYEFGTNTGDQDVMQAPLGPVRYFTATTGPGNFGPPGGGLPLPQQQHNSLTAGLNTRDMFQDDGGEVYFTLPNGMLAFYITDGADKRLDKVPGAKDAIFAGYSCMACHAHGPIAKADMVAAAAASLNLNPQEQAAVAALYPAAAVFSQQVQADDDAYASALAKLGIAAADGDPISAVVHMAINENQ